MNDVLDGYAAAAPLLIERFESFSSAELLEPVLDLIPRHSGRAIDIGAGTGRDAAWLAKQGHDVVAVEPVRELREAGKVIHHALPIRFLDDCLPALELALTHGQFDLVLACAVWQHLDDDDRARGMLSLAKLTAPGGTLIMSLRHGPGPAGRRVFPVTGDATVELARQAGLSVIRRAERDSIQPGNRAAGVRWTWLAFAGKSL